MLAPLFLASLVRGHATLAKFDPRLVRHIRDIAQLPTWNAINYDEGPNIVTGAKDGCKSAAWLMQLYFPHYENQEFPTLVYKNEVICGDATNAVGCFLEERLFADNGLEDLVVDHQKGAIVVKDDLVSEYEFHVCLHELIHAVGFRANLQLILDSLTNRGDTSFQKTLCQLWKHEHGESEEQPKTDGHWGIDESSDTREQKTGAHIYWQDQAGVDESQSEHELMTVSVQTNFAAGSNDVVSYLSASTLYAIQLFNRIIITPTPDIPMSLRNDNNNNQVLRRWCFPIEGRGNDQITLFGCETDQRCVSVRSLDDGQDKRVEDAFDDTWDDLPGVCVNGDDGDVITDNFPGLPINNNADECDFAPFPNTNTNTGGGGGGGGGFIITSSASLPEGPLVFWTVLLAAGATTLAVVSVI